MSGTVGPLPIGPLEDLARKALARDAAELSIQFEGRWIPFAEIRALADKVARLVEASGVASDAPVLFIARNLPASLAVLLALIAARRSVRMLYAFQSEAAISGEVQRLKPVLVIAAEQDLGERVRAALREQGSAAIALGPMAAAALPGLDRSTAIAENGPAEPTIEIQTSGTTGPPKHFPVSYEMAARHFIAGHPMYAGVRDASELPPAQLYSPMANLSGMMSTLPALLLGQRIILLDRLDLHAWVDYVRTYRPPYMGLQPVLVRMLLDANVPREQLASIRSIVTGSAPLDPETHREFEAKYGIPILLSYGATESLGTVAAWTPELRERWGEAKFGSVGPAAPGFQIRVVDPDSGEVLPHGQEGVIEVLAPKIRPDWTRTSDLGVLDEHGFVYLRGRADGAIMRGGFKVLPETIERALQTHPGVFAAAVAGVPDRRLGQVPAAAIQLRSGVPRPTPDELEAHLRQQVLATHIPVYWRFVDEVPRTPSLKVDRRSVARMFALGQTPQLSAS
jgi:acyl-coenzyme A synthetase/AMP-(fatty) acid ligase